MQHGKALVTFMVNGGVRLGSDTTAHIRTGTLLGQRVLTLESDGKGTLQAVRRDPGVAHRVAVLADASR